MRTIRGVPKIGDSSWNVVTLQEQLAKWISAKTPKEPDVYIDGIFGESTAKLIERFQKEKEIRTNFPGTLTPQTLTKLGLQVLVLNPVINEETITKDFVGKKDRRIHPDLRIAFEQVAFPYGKIPDFFKQKDLIKCKVHLSTAFAQLKISEGSKNNFGKEVGWIQGTTGKFVPGGNGDDWCMDQTQVIIAMLEDFYQVESPFPATPSTILGWNEASKIPGLTLPHCEAGTTLIAKRSETRGHSMDVIREISWDTIETLEGNNENRSGIFQRNKWVNGDLVTLGFIRAFPNNRLPNE